MYEAGIADTAPIAVCINGCSDDTEERVCNFREKFPDVKTDIIYSKEGLVNAQREIVKRYPANIYVFPDGDNTIEKRSIKNLLAVLEKEKGVIVAYAKTTPFLHEEHPSIFGKMGYLYDSQMMLEKRKYFHGRLFAIRDWYMPEDEAIAERAKQKPAGKYLLKYTKKGIFLYADDVFMSNYIIRKYGLEAIRQVEDAESFSFAVGSFSDWWNVYRRTVIELEKIRKWFPEYDDLLLYKPRKTDWKKWRAAPPWERMLWLVFIMMRVFLIRAARVELLLARFSWFHPDDQWRVTISTKKGETHA
jgi:hypothetical protein